jgi:hypothetical protein
MCSEDEFSDIEIDRRHRLKKARRSGPFGLAETATVKLALLANLVSAIRLARGVERFPAGPLPCGATILQVYRRLVEYRIQARSISVRHASRDERAAATGSKSANGKQAKPGEKAGSSTETGANSGTPRLRLLRGRRRHVAAC